MEWEENVLYFSEEKNCSFRGLSVYLFVSMFSRILNLNPIKIKSRKKLSLSSSRDGVCLDDEIPTRLGNRRSDPTKISMSPLSPTSSLSLEMTDIG